MSAIIIMESSGYYGLTLYPPVRSIRSIKWKGFSKKFKKEFLSEWKRAFKLEKGDSSNAGINSLSNLAEIVEVIESGELDPSLTFEEAECYVINKFLKTFNSTNDLGGEVEMKNQKKTVREFIKMGYEQDESEQLFELQDNFFPGAVVSLIIDHHTDELLLESIEEKNLDSNELVISEVEWEQGQIRFENCEGWAKFGEVIIGKK